MAQFKNQHNVCGNTKSFKTFFNKIITCTWSKGKVQEVTYFILFVTHLTSKEIMISFGFKWKL